MHISIIILGTIGFFVSLFVMYRTNHGIPGIQKYDPNFQLLDMRFRYNRDIVYETFEKIGAKGRKAYKDYLVIDFIFIACFLIVMTAISLAVTTNPVFNYALIGLAVSRAVLDILENTMIIILINKYPNKRPGLSDFCSWATTVKFITLYLWFIGLILSLVIKLT
jgi:hypothetical protein